MESRYDLEIRQLSFLFDDPLIGEGMGEGKYTVSGAGELAWTNRFPPQDQPHAGIVPVELPTLCATILCPSGFFCDLSIILIRGEGEKLDAISEPWSKSIFSFAVGQSPSCEWLASLFLMPKSI